MSARFPSICRLAAAAASTLTLTAGAQTSTVTFDTSFEVSDTFEGASSGLNAADDFRFTVDSGRVGFGGASLPRFDSSLGRLETVTLDVSFDRSEVSFPIGFVDAAGGATTANIDSFLLRRGIVFGVNTGFLRPLVIASGSQSLDLDAIDANGLATTTSPLSVQIDVPTTGISAFIPDGTREAPPLATEGAASFSFTGVDELGFVFRRTNELTLSLDRDDVDVQVTGGLIEYSGTVSVTYGFTPIPEPASLALLGCGGLLLLSRRRA